MSKLAVFFPGMGYTKEKPLLYFSSKMAADLGYECIFVEYHDLPDKIRGNQEKMLLAGDMAYEQSCDALQDVDFEYYEKILFVGKSVGTIIAAKYAQKHWPEARLVLYTPLSFTFEYAIKDGVAFIGDADPWSDLGQVKDLAAKGCVPLHIYPGCNHSLERKGNQLDNIDILKNAMTLTYRFINQTDDN